MRKNKEPKISDLLQGRDGPKYRTENNVEVFAVTLEEQRRTNKSIDIGGNQKDYTRTKNNSTRMGQGDESNAEGATERVQKERKIPKGMKISTNDNNMPKQGKN